MSPLARIPFARAEQDPTGSCVRDGERDLGNARFAADVRRLAQRLGRLGVAPGDTVAVMLPNCAEIVTTMFAAWYRGSALTPVNAALTDDEARYQLQDSAAAVLLGDERARALAASVGIAWLDAASIHADEPDGTATEPDDGPVATAGDFALIIYTSGTTGRPKGVLLDHANLDAMSGSLVEHFSRSEEHTSELQSH